MFMIRISLLATGALCCLVPIAEAAPLSATQILGGFNAVIYGNFASDHDVEGRLLVGGNLTQGATFYNNPRGPAALSEFGELNVGGNVTASNTMNLNNGADAIVAGTSAASFNLNGGATIATNVGAFFDLDEIKGAIETLGTELESLSANSTIFNPDQNTYRFDAAPDPDGLAVFDVQNVGALQNASNITFQFNGADTVIIRVPGVAFAQGGGSNFNGDAFTNGHVLWYFPDATTLFFKFWHGAVIAPNAAISNTSPIEGALVAQSIHASGELHDYPFLGDLPMPPPPPPTPAPASLAILGLGVVLLSRARR